MSLQGPWVYFLHTFLAVNWNIYIYVSRTVILVTQISDGETVARANVPADADVDADVGMKWSKKRRVLTIRMPRH